MWSLRKISISVSSCVWSGCFQGTVGLRLSSEALAQDHKFAK